MAVSGSPLGSERRQIRRRVQMDRITIGAALGGAAVYFLDPQRGEDRRRRVQSFWRENRDTAFEVGGGVSQAAESMRPLVQRVKRGFGRGGWTEGGRPNRVPRVIAIIVAAALGGALVYFLDPEKGSGRRQRVLSAKLRAKQAANETSEAVEEVGVKGRVLRNSSQRS